MPSESRAPAAGTPLPALDAGVGNGSTSSPRDPVEAIRALLVPETEPYRAALVAALDEARGVLHGLRTTGKGRVARTAGELGDLAQLVDPARFDALLDPEEGPDPGRLQRFEQAVSILEHGVDGASQVAMVAVPEGESLRAAVARALAERGRSYGAVRAMALLRNRAFSEDEHVSLLDGMPFRDWRALERELAPPLLVSVPGSALAEVAGLAEFLDGRQKIVLLVQPPAAPAPLARLVAPGVLVLQADDPGELARVVAFQGPAVAALVPEASALFLHDGTAGDGAGHLEVRRLPTAPPRSWVGGMSPAQQAAELRLLEAWARPAPVPAYPAAAGAAAVPAPAQPAGALPPTATGAAPPAGSADPVDFLAAWLLSQAGPDAPAG